MLNLVSEHDCYREAADLCDLLGLMPICIDKIETSRAIVPPIERPAGLDVDENTRTPHVTK